MTAFHPKQTFAHARARAKNCVSVCAAEWRRCPSRCPEGSNYPLPPQNLQLAFEAAGGGGVQAEPREDRTTPLGPISATNCKPPRTVARVECYDLAFGWGGGGPRNHQTMNCS